MTNLLEHHLLEIAYLIASLTFIAGLKLLSHPDSARNGNLIAAAGMILAIIATIFLFRDAQGNYLGNYIWIFSGIAIGTVIGTAMAVKVQMTSMPQMVSFFNGMGGACAAAISLIEFRHFEPETGAGMASGAVLVMLLGVLIGSVSFSGSLVAYGKLEGKIGDIRSRYAQIFNIILLLFLLSAIGYQMSLPEPSMVFLYTILCFSLVYGVMFVLPIGGADMPVVISLLNSFTGLAAALGGFLYDNSAMLTGGILVGSAGTILTVLMCRAMNRSLTNVLIGAFSGSSAGGGASADGLVVKEVSAYDAAIMLTYSQKVLIVPGFGLAVAQAQHICHELEKNLEARGVDVKFAIHPVAGRMPGHMNVLLAEADVPYEKLLEMEEANSELKTTDVVMVIGANDVVNPAARHDTASPIYGMPIINVDEAKHVIVMKRGMAKGYAGIENELFYYDNTRMLFGDAKKSIQELVSEINKL